MGFVLYSFFLFFHSRFVVLLDVVNPILRCWHFVEDSTWQIIASVHDFSCNSVSLCSLILELWQGVADEVVVLPWPMWCLSTSGLPGPICPQTTASHSGIRALKLPSRRYLWWAAGVCKLQTVLPSFRTSFETYYIQPNIYVSSGGNQGTHQKLNIVDEKYEIILLSAKKKCSSIFREPTGPG